MSVSLLIVSGNTSRIKAREVIRIGRRRIRIVISVVLIIFLFFFFMRFLANLTIKIAFLVDKLIVVSKFIIK